MKKYILISIAITVTLLAALCPVATTALDANAYSGSAVCRECHEKFHDLWSTSTHGKAAHPYTEEIAEKDLTTQKEDIVIGHYRYRAKTGKKEGYILETGPEGEKQYRIEYIVGGKSVYNFLTILPNGRHQSLPIGYDREKRKWFDELATRSNSIDNSHFDWKANPPWFYTSCPSCHVSQYSPSYDIDTATYKATWKEPGINCETCHGSAVEHIKIARNAPKGQSLAELGLLRPSKMTTEQRIDMCIICHSHMEPVTASFKPGDRFFDNFNFLTLEINAFYADGRGKGETFTLTNWLMSPCAKSAKLDCMHCHTSSGRYRFQKPEEANNACLPCHQDLIKSSSAHSHHKADSTGNRCISCHMSPTYYALMKQSDHSMLAPNPAATIAFGSPNACNACHTDKDAVWASEQVRIWYARDYQAPMLKRARLVDDARNKVWEKLPEMLDYIQSKDRNEVFATTLIRCMLRNKDARILPVLLTASKDRSPLIRSAAVQALGTRPSPESRLALLNAANDDYRLVRINAAYALTTYLLSGNSGDLDPERFNKALDDLLSSVKIYPNQWSSYETTGNVYQVQGRFKEAETAYRTAIRITPKAVNVVVSLSNVYLKQGEFDKAEEILRQATKIDPNNTAATLSLEALQSRRKNFINKTKSQ